MDIQLTANEIYEKSFKNAITGGYNKGDVDEFLDIVIQDYEKFDQVVSELQEEINRLRKQQGQTNNNQQQQQTTQLHANYDILKRISNLEKAVFGQKTNE
ncbi:MAG TPA: cell division regulator GpsB [Pseudogracilibacillus sp.]|nr:cell division regulator GpsB [Pseudogracilibacillus sp.]